MALNGLVDKCILDRVRLREADSGTRTATTEVLSHPARCLANRLSLRSMAPTALRIDTLTHALKR